MAHLFLFQLGPVQSFIAAGRRTQDLYVGSRMLSELAKAGLLSSVQQAPRFTPIFPMFENVTTLPQGIPHRFAFISTGEPYEIADIVEQAVRDHWRDEFAYKVYEKLSRILENKNHWQEMFRDQMESWIEFYWVAVEYSEDSHSESLQQANAALAQRKLFRYFPQVEEPGRKCTLTGAQAALKLDWDRLRKGLNDPHHSLIRDHEFLGTLALIKRLAIKAKCELGFGPKPRTIRSTSYIAGLTDDEEGEADNSAGRRQEAYLAVLHMDGDRMGERLSTFKQLQAHQGFSQKLVEFADTYVPDIINEYGGQTGQLIYAGGDDVLALLPLSHVLGCADKLREKFYELTGCSASAGIAIIPHDFPLDAALDIAREAEHKAKEEYGRNAVVVTEAHGSGMIRHAGGPWEMIGLVEKFYDYFKKGHLSGKIGYDLTNVAHYMGGQVPTEARKAEVTRLLRRRTAEGLDLSTRTEIEALAEEIVRLGDSKDKNIDSTLLNWESVAHWVILARFLAQPSLEQTKAPTEKTR